MLQSTFICHTCGRNYSVSEKIWRCACGGLFDLVYNPQFDPNLIKKRKPNLWRYREAIPIENDSAIISFEEGFTPLLEINIAGIPILVKQEHLFQTGSYKDRGATVLISKSKELGINHVVEDSSGNAGCAIAAYAARAGIKCDIYVPESTSPAKLAQIESYGARLHKIPGSREDTARAVQVAAETCYYASHSWNPFFFQGTKTIAFEIWEQLGWQVPNVLVLPVGNGTLLLGAYFGFQDLTTAGMISEIPQLIGVQAQNCSPLAQAFAEPLSQFSSVSSSATIAEGIAIAEPIRAEEILRAVKHSGGRFVTVTDGEITLALKDTMHSGFYIEPTSATVIAAISKISGSLINQKVVTVFSGHGLKSTEKILSLLNHKFQP